MGWRFSQELRFKFRIWIITVFCGEHTPHLFEAKSLAFDSSPINSRGWSRPGPIAAPSEIYQGNIRPVPLSLIKPLGRLRMAPSGHKQERMYEENRTDNA